MKFIRIFVVFLALNLYLCASVFLNSSNSFIKDEPYIFELEASGNDIKFPKIEKIDGYIVENIGNARSIQVINGNYQEKITKRYKILPKKDFEIPSFTFTIDGDEVKTKPKKVFQKKIHKTNSNNFDLTLIPSKTELFVGEELKIKLIFKYRKGLRITDLGFEKPHFSNFWYKKVDSSNGRYEENGFIIQELDFLLFPQKSGQLLIPALNVVVQMVDDQSQNAFGFFSLSPKIVKVYSNELKFDVKEIPNGVKLIGEFFISAKLDKTKIKLGEAISYKLTVSGWGNLDDIEDMKLDIPSATIYENKPELKADFKDEKYQGVFTKVYSIIPNESLEIPSIKLKYYSKKDKEIKTVKTKKFQIEVEGKKEIKEPVLQKAEPKKQSVKEIIVEKKASLQDKILFFILGIVFSLFILSLYKYIIIRKSKESKKETSLLKLVKKSRDKQTLLKILAPHVKKDEKLDNLIYECQGRKDFRSLKDEIIRLLKELKI